MQKDRSDSFSENLESKFDIKNSGNMLDRSDNEERDRERRGRGRDRGNARMSDRDRSPRGKKRGNRVFVSNIPYEFRWQELKDLFREQVGEVSFVELFVDESDKPRGCGIIEFATTDLAKEAVEKMHRHDLKGRKLVVKEDNDNDRDKFGRIISRNERNRREPERSWNDIPSLINGPQTVSSGTQRGNSYGLSTQFLESLNINGPLVPRCFVANLDYKVDDKKLKEVFRLAGRVISAEISTDKEGKSRGFGVVEYEHPVEAVQAISMLHNQTLYDRRLSVRMDRIDKGDGIPAKLPEGLKGLGMGLGANGVPLQDVARNLPNSQQGVNPTPTPVVPPLSAVSNPALAAAALGKFVNNLMAGTGTANDITSLAANSLGLNPAALTATTNPLAAQFLSSAASASGASSLNPFATGSTGGRDFDSLSAALSNNTSYNQSASANDRSRSGGMSSSLQGASDTIIIKNLPPTITWQMLREKCRDAGDVTFAEIKNKDTGIVRFANQWDAQRAINMLDRIRVEGRVIDVRFY